LNVKFVRNIFAVLIIGELHSASVVTANCHKYVTFVEILLQISPSFYYWSGALHADSRLALKTSGGHTDTAELKGLHLMEVVREAVVLSHERVGGV